MGLAGGIGGGGGLGGGGGGLGGGGRGGGGGGGAGGGGEKTPAESSESSTVSTSGASEHTLKTSPVFAGTMVKGSSQKYMDSEQGSACNVNARVAAKKQCSWSSAACFNICSCVQHEGLPSCFGTWLKPVLRHEAPPLFV